MSPRDISLKMWSQDEMPHFRSLLATASHAADALRTGADAIRASADQLSAVTADGEWRLAAYPHSDSDILSGPD